MFFWGKPFVELKEDASRAPQTFGFFCQSNLTQLDVELLEDVACNSQMLSCDRAFSFVCWPETQKMSLTTPTIPIWNFLSTRVTRATECVAEVKRFWFRFEDKELGGTGAFLIDSPSPFLSLQLDFGVSVVTRSSRLNQSEEIDCSLIWILRGWVRH